MITFASVTGNYGHKSAVADYIMQAAEKWGQMWVTFEDNFLSRLLSAREPEATRTLSERGKGPDLGEEAALLLA